MTPTANTFWRAIGWWGATTLLLVVGVAALRVVAYREVQPCAQTLREHLAMMPVPVDFRHIDRGGLEYLAVHGPMPPIAALASGNPIYVFDRSGALVDWTPDAGDDEDFHRDWPGIYGGTRMSRAEAEVWAAAVP